MLVLAQVDRKRALKDDCNGMCEFSAVKDDTGVL